MVLCQPGTVTSHSKIKSQVYVLKKSEGGRHTPFVASYSPQLFTETANVTVVTIKLPEEKGMVMPGNDTVLKLTLNTDSIQSEFEYCIISWHDHTLFHYTDIPIEKGQRFTLRERHGTVGMGVVTDILE